MQEGGKQEACRRDWSITVLKSSQADVESFLIRARPYSCPGVGLHGSWLCSLSWGSLMILQSCHWPNEYSGLMVLPQRHSFLWMVACVYSWVMFSANSLPVGFGGLAAYFHYIQSQSLPAQIVNVSADVILWRSLWIFCESYWDLH